MRSLVTRISTLIVSLTLALGVTPLALAAGITISPPKFEFDADPGQTITDVIKITNQESSALTLTPSVQDFVSGGETGQPSFIDADKNDAAISIGAWINVNNGGQTVTAQPGKQTEIPFTLTVPRDAEPGGHYGAIFFSPPGGEGQIGVTQRIGTLILVRVRGDVTTAGRLDRFDTFATSLDVAQITEAAAKFFYGSLPVKFAVRYQNTGNIHTKPEGKIEIRNFGIKLDPVGVHSVVNERGLETKKEIVDYIPVNDSRGNVLAKSYRTFTADWAGRPYWHQNEDGTKEIAYKGFPIGFYSATLTLTGAEGQPTTDTTHFVVFPWKEIFGVLILAIGAWYGLRWYRAWSAKRMEEEFKKRYGVK